jgi:hypothetical protein
MGCLPAFVGNAGKATRYPAFAVDAHALTGGELPRLRRSCARLDTDTAPLCCVGLVLA